MVVGSRYLPMISSCHRHGALSACQWQISQQKVIFQVNRDVIWFRGIFFSTSFTRKSLFYAIVHFGVFLNPWYTVQKTRIRSQGALHPVFWNSMHGHYHVHTAPFRLKVFCLFFTWDILHIILYVNFIKCCKSSTKMAIKWLLFYKGILWSFSFM